MKIQLDTENKTIKLESEVQLSKLVETLESLLPKGEWKKFTLQTNTTISYWSNPIIIREYPKYEPWTPWQPWYLKAVCSSQTAEYKVDNNHTLMALKDGIYNIEV